MLVCDFILFAVMKIDKRVLRDGEGERANLVYGRELQGRK